MSLKFVYALVSSENDYYAEQALISMHSLRLHNPDACIVLVTDSATLNTLTGNRSRIKDYIDEYVTVNPPVEFTPVQKSRFIKTSLRQNVKGDFLYIDNDTIIVDSLCELEDLDCEMGAVLNCHCTGENDRQLRGYLDKTKKTYWDYNRYFNNGVLFVKDTANTRKFFADWHNLWNEEMAKFGISIDQPSSAQANVANGCLITEIDGRFNCQIFMSGAKRYILNPCILHYFNASNRGLSHPLKDKRYMRDIREKGAEADLNDIIRTAHSAFLLSWRVLDDEERRVYELPMAMLGRKLARDYAWTNKVAKFIYRLFGFKI